MITTYKTVRQETIVVAREGTQITDMYSGEEFRVIRINNAESPDTYTILSLSSYQTFRSIVEQTAHWALFRFLKKNSVNKYKIDGEEIASIEI